MPKDEWGVKRVCPSCSTRFYDLQNNPMTCPSCAHEFTLESLTGNKSRTMQADKPDAQNKEAEPAEEDEVILDDEDDDDDDADVVLGDDILEEDDDEDTVSLDELADVAKEDDDN